MFHLLCVIIRNAPFPMLFKLKWNYCYCMECPITDIVVLICFMKHNISYCVSLFSTCYFCCYLFFPFFTQHYCCYYHHLQYTTSKSCKTHLVVFYSLFCFFLFTWWCFVMMMMMINVLVSILKVFGTNYMCMYTVYLTCSVGVSPQINAVHLQCANKQ